MLGQQHPYQWQCLAVQTADGATGPELPLATPSTANWLQTSLPPGSVSVIVYVQYADSAVTSPLGLPAGSRLQVCWPQLHCSLWVLYSMQNV